MRWWLLVVLVACHGDDPPADVPIDIEGPLPTISQEQGCVSSEACRSCHPVQYETWA